MVEIKRENPVYLVELDVDDDITEHVPHKSWGTYRVVDRRSNGTLFFTRNRDKSYGVFEYLSHEAGLS